MRIQHSSVALLQIQGDDRQERGGGGGYEATARYPLTLASLLDWQAVRRIRESLKRHLVNTPLTVFTTFTSNRESFRSYVCNEYEFEPQSLHQIFIQQQQSSLPSTPLPATFHSVHPLPIRASRNPPPTPLHLQQYGHSVRLYNF